MKIVTTAFPFVPAVLGIHHFASTYLPADVFCRALRLMGDEVLLVNATDFHSIYATTDGMQNIDTCHQFHDSYLKAYKASNINFDFLMTTDNPIHIEMVNNAVRAVNSYGLLYRKNSTVIYCDQCNTYLPLLFREIKDGIQTCKFCGSNKLSELNSEHVWLRISACKDLIRKYQSQCTQPEVAKEINRFLKELSDWDFTRDSQFGLRYNDRLTIYLWFESLVGYYSLVPTEYKKDAEFIHFFGKNIVYYHGIVWPILLHCLSNGSTRKVDLSVRGFMSSQSAIELDMEKLCDRWGTDTIRYYIIYKVHDSISDFTLKESEINEVVTQNLIRRSVHLVNRVRGLLTSMAIEVLKYDEAFASEMKKKYINNICESYRKMHINAALKRIAAYASYGNAILSKGLESHDLMIGNLAYLVVSMTLLLFPIIPQAATEMLIFQWDQELRISDIDKILSSRLKKESYSFPMNN